MNNSPARLARARITIVAAVVVAASFLGGVAAAPNPSTRSTSAATLVALCTATNPDPALAAIVQDLCAQAAALDQYAAPSATSTTAAPTTTTVPPTTVSPTTVVPQSTRDLRLWPFASSSPWNTPRGDGAVFDSRSILSTGGVNINDLAYGVTVNGAGYTSPAQQGLELATVNVQTDGVTAFESTAFISPDHVVTDLHGSGINETVAGKPGEYLRATKFDLLGGLLRNKELQAAAAGDIHAIKHALALGISSHVLNKTFAWPAAAADSFAGTNTGFMPEGGFMAIPSTAVMPAGLNPVAQAIWEALRDYGAYAADATGQNGTLTVVENEAAASTVVNPIRGAQISNVLAQVRQVTNASQTNVGGPGNRLEPLAP